MAEYNINNTPEKPSNTLLYQIKNDVYPKQVSNKYIIEQADNLGKAFGLSILKTEIYRAGMPKSDYERDKPLITDRKSILGNHIFSDLKFGDITLPSGEKLTHTPIDLCLFTVNNSFNVVTTTIQGRNRSVKEFTSGGDDIINIKVQIDGKNGQYPRDSVQSLIRYLNAAKQGVTLPVQSWYLQMLDIYELVITGFTMEQEKGKPWSQLFEITALSDAPVELMISEAKPKSVLFFP
jgi:hypothetical protein